MDRLHIDIETYSSRDLIKGGVYNYTASPDFQILLFAYAFNNENINIVDLTSKPLPEDIVRALNNPDIKKVAHNAVFEFTCLSKFYQTDFSQWECTLFKSAYCGYPLSLAAVATALKLPQNQTKMKEGKALIRTFCLPCKPTKTNGNRTRTLPHHEPEKWELFKLYCMKDVEVERVIDDAFKGYVIPSMEEYLFQLDHIINSYGVMIDFDLVAQAVAMFEKSKESLTDESKALSGINNPGSVQQLKAWLESQGLEVINLNKASIPSLIGATDDETIKRVLELRQDMAKSSVKKYTAMISALGEDNRVRGMLQFYGANRTGRWAGRLVQLHNLPRNYIGNLDLARQLVKDRKENNLELIYGPIPDTLSQLIRTSFIAPPNHQFVIADFSAIEARVIAWLADEKWRLEVFKGHGKIYEASASAMFGVPLESIVKGGENYHLRATGKVAELALGYQGSVGALVQMKALDMGLTEEELPGIVARWRGVNKMIEALWYKVEAAAIDTVQTARTNTVGCLTFRKDHRFLLIDLPSGRTLHYAEPLLLPGKFGKEQISYHGMNQTSKKWELVPTYGGKLVENIIQAIARDCLAVTMFRLAQANLRIVMHVHDEVVIESMDPERDLQISLNIMAEPIPWAIGLPLKGEGFISPYYKKE